MQTRTKGIVIALVLLTAILPLMLLIWLVDGGDDFAAIDQMCIRDSHPATRPPTARTKSGANFTDLHTDPA